MALDLTLIIPCCREETHIERSFVALMDALRRSALAGAGKFRAAARLLQTVLPPLHYFRWSDILQHRWQAIPTS
jgi:hypothetical protein